MNIEIPERLLYKYKPRHNHKYSYCEALLWLVVEVNNRKELPSFTELKRQYNWSDTMTSRFLHDVRDTNK